jgi:hypothetical protein
LIFAEGLNEFRKDLRAAQSQTLKELSQTHKRIGEIVADEAERRAPKRSGRLARSIKSSASQRDVRVRGGGREVPYFGVQEFGGSVPSRKDQSYPRRRIKPYRGPLGRSGPWWDENHGYFLHPAARAKREEILEAYLEAMDELTERVFPERR